MNILFRAIITGFGLRLGSEVARTIATKMRDRGGDDDEKETKDADKDAEADEEEEHPTSITPDPPAV